MNLFLERIFIVLNRCTLTLFLIISLLHCSVNLQARVLKNEVTFSVNVTLKSVSNIDANTAWVCGVSGTVLKTTDYRYNRING
jgi:hypothetical protein